MGKRGPLPQSVKTKRRHGETRASRLTTTAHDAAGRVGAPRMPRDLSPAARQAWRRLMPQLIRAGLATRLDELALADVCELVARLKECRASIAKYGLLIKGARGVVKNPILQVERETRAALQRWAAEFGLTAGSRGRINVEPPPEPMDALEELLFEIETERVSEENNRLLERGLHVRNGAGAHDDG